MPWDRIQGEHLIFDFVVHNGSPDTLDIRPADFFYEVLDSANRTDAILHVLFPRGRADVPVRLQAGKRAGLFSGVLQVLGRLILPAILSFTRMQRIG